MEIRTTERGHKFTNQLFLHLNLFSIQGLTMDSSHNFTAAIEAVQYGVDETISLNEIFPLIEVQAKYAFARSIGVPLYFIIFKNDIFEVFDIIADPDFLSNIIYRFNEKEFIAWWATLKGLNQPKKLMEAAERVKDSIFDKTLEKYGMAWGGNIDGFMFKNQSLACIVENIYTQKNPLESEKGEPSYYFNMMGPNYNTWFPTVKLASRLGIPLFLFTIEGNNNLERIGFAVIDKLSTKGIFYLDKKPNENILVGLDVIKKTVCDNLNNKPPVIFD